eukprot:SAG11_NODE_1426_length_4943_cov_7.372419_5_plen_120_part_00
MRRDLIVNAPPSAIKDRYACVVVAHSEDRCLGFRSILLLHDLTLSGHLDHIITMCYTMVGIIHVQRQRPDEKTHHNYARRMSNSCAQLEIRECTLAAHQQLTRTSNHAYLGLKSQRSVR